MRQHMDDNRARLREQRALTFSKILGDEEQDAAIMVRETMSKQAEIMECMANRHKPNTACVQCKT